MRYLFFLFIGCFIKAIFTKSDSRFKLFFSHQETIFDDSIPTPESIVGHQIGEWHITHDKLLQYMEVLAKSSDRIKIENRGFTYEDRPLILLTITSPENHQNIDLIKKEHKFLMVQSLIATIIFLQAFLFMEMNRVDQTLVYYLHII